MRSSSLARSGRARTTVQEMLVQFSVETVDVDTALAERAAAARVRTALKLPDAFALATVIHAEHRGWDDVELATFDEDVVKAHAALHLRDLRCRA
jgi:predicted nucleic acid-binding protein